MRVTVALILGLILASLGVPARARADTAAPPAAATAINDYLSGAWVLYSSRFVDASGRIVDDGNGDISHSEGQGSAMLLAATAGDRASFDRIWGWTQANLMVRGDGLAGWKWDPKSDPHVADTNNASDGDLLIAWGLLRAQRRWGDDAYGDAVRNILAALTRETVVTVGRETLLLPGAKGFGAKDRPDGPVVNLSYWIFPALQQLGEFDPDFPGQKLIESGLSLVERAHFGPQKLPPDWMSVKGNLLPADGFPARFSYDAIRVPLYLAWYEGSDARAIAPFYDAWFGKDASFAVVDLRNGGAEAKFADPGYVAIGNLVLCATGHKAAGEMKDFTLTQYYPSMLGMLTVLAMAERYPACLIDASQ